MMTAGGSSSSSSTKAMNGLMEDGDNRSRNAKAQRRHREKRKAHLKTLEENVQILTAQLDDARRQLSMGNFGGNRLGGPMSPQSKEYAQLQAENVYLRDENADLRRQLYAYRVNYGHMAPPPGSDGAEKGWGEVKQEGGFTVNYGQSGLSSPRAESSSRNSGTGNNGNQGNNSDGRQQQDYMGVGGQQNHHHHHHPQTSPHQQTAQAPPPHHYSHSPYGMAPAPPHPGWS